jgi:hypothetical protein
VSEETRLSRTGRFLIRRSIRNSVRNRLLLRQALERNPDLADGRPDRPLFIVGPNRTGTTLLHNLLALAEDARAPRTWELLQPAPPCAAAGPEAFRRRLRTRMMLLVLHRLSPRLRRVHRIGVDDREECYPLINNTFTSPAFVMHFGLRRYARWLDGLDPARLGWVYREYVTQLGILDPGRSGRRWVLKSAVHLYFLDALLRELPGALIVQTHRDPRRMIASTCSLVASLRQVVFRSVDRVATGSESFELVRLLLERGRQARRNHPKAGIVDIDFEELVADPVGQVRRIHERFDLAWTRVHERRMRDWLATNPANRDGRHDYDPATYGLEDAPFEELESRTMIGSGSGRP